MRSQRSRTARAYQHEPVRGSRLRFSEDYTTRAALSVMD